MFTEKETILKILTAIKPGLAKKAIIEQFTHFVFTGNNIITYNDQICISHPFHTDFVCSVPAERLYKTLTGIQGNPNVKFEVEEGEFKIKTATAKAGFSTQVGTDAQVLIKNLKLDEIDQWMLLPKKFMDGMYLCMFTASRDMTRGLMTCVQVANNRILSADKYRASMYDLGTETGMNTFIPASSVKELVTLMGQPRDEKDPEDVVYGWVSESWAHFKDNKNGVIFSSRIMDGEPLGIDKLFDEANKLEGAETTMPQELKGEIDSISFMVEGLVDLDKKVEVTMKEGKLSCYVEDNIGWIQKSVKCDYKGEEIFFVTNPNFLSQVMEKAVIAKITEKMVLFYRNEFTHLFALASKDEEE